VSRKLGGQRTKFACEDKNGNRLPTYITPTLETCYTIPTRVFPGSPHIREEVVLFDTKDNGSGDSCKLETTVHRATSVEYEGTFDHLT
jgi:hypothetical protein